MICFDKGLGMDPVPSVLLLAHAAPFRAIVRRCPAIALLPGASLAGKPPACFSAGLCMVQVYSHVESGSAVVAGLPSLSVSLSGWLIDRCASCLRSGACRRLIQQTNASCACCLSRTMFRTRFSSWFGLLAVFEQIVGRMCAIV